MAAAFTDGYDEAGHRAAELRERSLELAQVELHAYEPVLEALRLPREDPERDAKVRAAEVEASRSPLEIAQIAAELADHAAVIARDGNPNLAGDAITGALLAEAGAQAAARLVAINLAPDDSGVRTATELATRALNARKEALN
jgi:formiminotetrahydrofolate cyclodeaminase